MSFPRRQSSTRREAVYEAALAATQAQLPGAEHPLCNICGLWVTPGQRWHESHMPAPHAITGAPPDGIAHDRCNLERAAKHDVPLIAHVRRVRRRFIGAHRSRNPMRGGRDDNMKRTMDGHVVDRRTGLPFGQKQPEA